MSKILIVEDEETIADLEKDYLELSGFEVEVANDGETGLEKALKDEYSLFILDLMLPGVDGFEICRKIREEKNTPIIMVSAKKDDIDKIRGLGLGADDYMVKPVDVNEMVLRVGALLRRAKSVSERKQAFGKTVLEYDTLTVYSDGTEITLPQKEFMLLYKLLSYPNKIFTRQQIMDDIWGPDSYTDAHTVDVHINRLRDRFRDNRDFEIVTVRGLGYKAVRKQ